MSLPLSNSLDPNGRRVWAYPHELHTWSSFLGPYPRYPSFDSVFAYYALQECVAEGHKNLAQLAKWIAGSSLERRLVRLDPDAGELRKTFEDADLSLERRRRVHWLIDDASFDLCSGLDAIRSLLSSAKASEAVALVISKGLEKRFPTFGQPGLPTDVARRWLPIAVRAIEALAIAMSAAVNANHRRGFFLVPLPMT